MTASHGRDPQAPSFRAEKLTHYFSDRRAPLERLAGLLGKSGFYRAGSGLAAGAALLDQAWHWAWLFASALVISGGPR